MTRYVVTRVETWAVEADSEEDAREMTHWGPPDTAQLQVEELDDDPPPSDLTTV